MKQCFGYVRVSTTKQGEGVSLEAQKDAILAFCERNSITISQWFEEKQTAAKDGRPVFNALLRQLKAGKAAGVVIHKIDRSARNFADWAKIAELSDRGIDIHFATETLDFRSRGGRLAADIQAVIAADYIRNLREETIKGITGRLKQGIYPFGAPVGYRDNGGGNPKTIDPIAGPLVRQLFDCYLSGSYSIRSLEAEMARRGLRNRNGKPLSKTGIETILNNPFYAGLIRIKRTGMTYSGAHEPLITMTEFERVQRIKSGKCGPKVTRHNHTFRGLFRCAECGEAMIAERQKRHVYYRCHTSGCPTTTVREELVDDAVRGVLRRMQLDPRHMVWLAERFAVWEEDRRCEDTRSIELQVQQTQARLERLTDAFIDQLIDDDTYTRKRQALLMEKTKHEERLAVVRNRRAHPQDTVKFLELAKSLAVSYETANFAEKRQIVEMATSNRRVTGKKVELEPQKWLLATQNAVGVLSGALQRDKDRSSTDIPDQHFLAVADAMREWTLHTPPDEAHNRICGDER